MLNKIQLKALELWNSIDARLEGMAHSERGQTSAEYVAVTAVAVAIAIGVIYVTLRDSLSTAVTNIGDAIESFVTTNV
jgi:Flp pilus assembly pilin Flp